MRAIGVRENHAGDNDLNQGTARKKTMKSMKRAKKNGKEKERINRLGAKENRPGKERKGKEREGEGTERTRK